MTTVTIKCDLCGKEWNHEDANQTRWDFSLSMRGRSKTYHGSYAEKKAIEVCRACAEHYGTLPPVDTPKDAPRETVEDLLRRILEMIKE